MKDIKKLGLDIILKEIKSGKNPAQISKEYKISKQKLQYDLDKLKKSGCIEKVGYGTWRYIKEVQIRPKDTSNPKFGLKEIRGHAFIWNIEFLEGGFDWLQIVENYKKKYKNPSLTFKSICGGKVPRVIFNKRKIWMTKKGLTIYEPLDFLGRSSFTVKGQAVFEMDRLIKDLLKKLRLKLQYYKFKCSREHFAHVKNQMARQFNENKEKIKVEFDGKHFWVDHSHGDHEEETDDVSISVQAQKHYKSQMKTKFAVTPEVILGNFKESSDQMKKILDMRNEDFKMIRNFGVDLYRHIPAYEGMKDEVKQLNGAIGLLISEIKKINK